MLGICAGSIYQGFKTFSFLFIPLLFIFIVAGLYVKQFQWEKFIRTAFWLLFFSLGYCLISCAICPDLPLNHVSKYADKGKLWIQGRVSSFPIATGKMEKLILSVDTIGLHRKGRTLFYHVTGKIRVGIGYYCSDTQSPSIKSYASKVRLSSLDRYGRRIKHYGKSIFWKKIHYGDTISFVSQIKPIRNFNNPGGFNYLRYMSFNSIFGSTWTRRDRIKLIEPCSYSGIFSGIFVSLLRSVENYRDDFSEFILKTIPNRDVASVLIALSTGKKEFLSKKLRSEFSKAGVSHILAISGLHLSIVAGIFFYFFNWLLSFSRFFLIRGWSRKAAAFLTLFPLLAYAAFSGFSPSTKRAFIMIAVFMFSFVAEREADPLNTLALAAIIILMISPGALFSISFQLSFSAVLFIIMGFILVKGRKIQYGNKFFIKFCAFVFTSFCAMAGTEILVMYYFNIISFVGIITNIILIPAIGFGAVPMEIAALLTHPFSAKLSWFFIKCAGWIIYPCLLFIHNIAELPFAWSRTITPDHMEIFCYYLFFAGIFLLLSKRKKMGVLCLVTAIIIVSANEIFWLNRRFFNKDLYITILDVGQGSSALLELPQGKRVLVDGGGFSYLSGFDTGQYIVGPFLWRKKIMSLDMVILTHPESDHMNGLIYILKNFKVRKFIKNCDKRKTFAYGELIRAIMVNGAKIDIITNKEKKLRLGKVVFDFLNPFIKCSRTKDSHERLNNNSVVFRLLFNKISVFFPGDIMNKAENKIALKYGDNIKSDILISPHHGSSTSISDFFLDKIDPKSIVISCGWHNRFHLPDSSVIKQYKKRGIQVFRTDLQGAITIRSNGNKFSFITFK